MGLDPGLLQLGGSHADTKYTSLHTVKFIAGLQTQRSPFAPIDTRYGTRFMGGKPDTLLSGSNCEITNRLTLGRRPGVSKFGPPVIPPPLRFENWQVSNLIGNNVLTSLLMLADTSSSVYRFSPTYNGIYFNKTTSMQTNFFQVGNTMYASDGVDQYKITGPNLLYYSNTFTNRNRWVVGQLTSMTPGAQDPLGQSSATFVQWSAANSGSYLQQSLFPNYTPVAGNTFTFSVYMRLNVPINSATTETVKIQLLDQVPSVVATATVTLNFAWQLYQITGVCSSGAATSGNGSLTVSINTPSSVANAIVVWGAQLEVGGPATQVNITTDQSQGVFKWGIAAPASAPTLTYSQFGSTWQAATNYNDGQTITDSNGNIQEVTQFGTTGSYPPVWAITQNSTTTDNTITWTELGPGGLSPKLGYQYYYAFIDDYTGQPSAVSPISLNTGALIGQQVTVHGNGSTDPQVTNIGIYRNQDGGPFFFQLAVIPNPGSGTWTYTDIIQDSGLNTSIYAPIGLINSPPEAGLAVMEYHAGRLFGAVGSIIYYASSNDNAQALNIIFNGVSAECWSPLNQILLDRPVKRMVSTTAGLLAFTTTDIWIITGQDLTSFFPKKILRGHGLASYNALDVDGANIWAYLSDRQLLQITTTGSSEYGFAIGNLLETQIDPTKAYVCRHIAGTQDNALYLGDGATGWFRLNPNQVGASLGGEQTPVWSPFATVNQGSCGALASLETTPGIHQMLVGQGISGPILVRNINIFTDNGQTYNWNAVIGSIYLAPSGQLAETESLTVESVLAGGGQVPLVSVLLDEISGSFENLTNSVNDPPQLTPSQSLNSLRYYLSQGAVPPLCKHLQIQLQGQYQGSGPDEVLTISIRGALVAEQS